MSRHTDLSTVPVSVAPSPDTSGTTFGVTDANAAKLPDKYPFWGLFKPSGAVATRANAEKVKVKSSTSSGGTTTYTIERGKGNPATTARAVVVGDDFMEVVSSQDMIDLETGWIELPEILTYASADSPVFVINTAIDLTDILSVGMKIKLTQTTVKYFIIVAINSSTITVYGGTDYTLANAAITLPFFSMVRAPYGFPMNPAKWTVEVVSTADLAQSSPTAAVWYNVALTIDIPIGVWDVYYQALLLVDYSTTVSALFRSTLSTSNNSESDVDMTCVNYLIGVTDQIAAHVSRRKNIAMTSKTTHYLLLMQSGQSPATSVLFWGSQNKSIIRAVCAYL